MRNRFTLLILAMVIGLIFLLALLNESPIDRSPGAHPPTSTATLTASPEGEGPTISCRTCADPTATATGPAPTLTSAPDPGQATPSGDSASPTPAVPERAAYRAMWISQETIETLPIEGGAWRQLRSVASERTARPDFYNKDSNGDVRVLAQALAYARTGEDDYRNAVLENLEAAMDEKLEPQEVSVLAVARNLPGYIVAADLVNLPQDAALDVRFRSWLQRLRATVFSGDGGSHSIASCHETRPNNFGTHCGAARLAIALYLGEEVEVDRAAAVFYGWLGNRQSYTGFEFGRLDWQADPDAPVGVNPSGATKDGHSIDGALPEEMRRGGEFRWPPKETGYAWEALQGAVVQAELLSRAGYPAWQWQEQALLRAVTFLYDLGWEADGDDTWQPWLVNYAYGTDFPVQSPAEPGKNLGWTDWTHGPERDPVMPVTPTQEGGLS